MTERVTAQQCMRVFLIRQQAIEQTLFNHLKKVTAWKKGLFGKWEQLSWQGVPYETKPLLNVFFANFMHGVCLLHLSFNK